MFWTNTVEENESPILCSMGFLHMLYGFLDNWTNQTLCIHFQISIFNYHHGLLITPKTEIICFSVIHGFSPSTSMDNQEYTVPAAAGLYINPILAWRSEMRRRFTTVKVSLMIPRLHVKQGSEKTNKGQNNILITAFSANSIWHVYNKKLQKCFTTPVYPSKLQNHWMDFHKIWYWGVLLKCICTFQFWLKSNNNNGHFTWWPKCVSMHSLV
jgi:hypothetical protein